RASNDRAHERYTFTGAVKQNGWPGPARGGIAVISERALIERIRRRLRRVHAADLRRLRLRGPRRRVWVVRLNDGKAIAADVELTDLAHRVGVLRPYESVAALTQGGRRTRVRRSSRIG